MVWAPVRTYTGLMPTKVSVAADREREILTAEDFLAWLEPGRQADLIDGEINMHSPVSLRHAQLLNFVDHVVRSYVEVRSLGQVFREVVAVRLSARNVFMPDLAFYRTDSTDARASCWWSLPTENRGFPLAS